MRKLVEKKQPAYYKGTNVREKLKFLRRKFLCFSDPL